MGKSSVTSRKASSVFTSQPGRGASSVNALMINNSAAKTAAIKMASNLAGLYMISPQLFIIQGVRGGNILAHTQKLFKGHQMPPFPGGWMRRQLSGAKGETRTLTPCGAGT